LIDLYLENLVIIINVIVICDSSDSDSEFISIGEATERDRKHIFTDKRRSESECR